MKAVDKLKFALGILVVVLGLLVGLARQPTGAAGLLRIQILDIGQGDAILIDTSTGEHILVDGGPRNSLGPQLASYLSDPKEFELVVATHNDADHIGGLIEALETYPTKEIWINGAVHTTETFEQWLKATKESQARVEVVKRGTHRDFGDLKLDVLYPEEDWTGRRPENNNDSSIVIKLSYGAVGALLAADLDQSNEEEIIKSSAPLLGSTILKATHHGSKYGNSSQFLNYVHPEVVVISVGKENRYGHPHQEALERLFATGAKVYRTDELGTIVITTDGSKLWVNGQSGARESIPILSPLEETSPAM